MFAKLLAALGLAPKTLPQATETLTAAKTFAESVNTLFTSAGLNLETMLAAGPDSLKAHLASIDNSAEVTRLTAELTTAKADHDKAKAECAALNASYTTISGIADKLGLTSTTAPTSAIITAKFEDFVSKQTTLALAKTGHPPAHVPAAEAPATAVATDAALYAEYSAMSAGPVRLDFYTKHEAALKRAHSAASKA